MTRRTSERRAAEVVLVGRGRVGRTLLARLSERGVCAALVAGRGLDRATRAQALIRQAKVVWLVVPDPHVAELEQSVARSLEGLSSRALPVVAHAGGARGPGVLVACAARGVPVAVAHPAVSFGTTHTRLEDTVFVIDGSPRATRRLSALVRRLGARPLVRSLHGGRYHAALALLANGATALAAAASHILVEGEPPLAPDEAARLLGSLLRSVADNVARVGPSAALTGPIARGDATAVAHHLKALSGQHRGDYVAVSHLVLRAARERGLDESAARAIAALLASDPSPPRARRSVSAR